MAAFLGVGGDVAPVQLEHMHAEIVTSNDRERALFDSLTRSLRGSLKKGWGIGKYWESRVTGALANWSVTWGDGDELQRIKRSLFAVKPPTGWIPEPSDDPILREAFRLARLAK